MGKNHSAEELGRFIKQVEHLKNECEQLEKEFDKGITLGRNANQQNNSERLRLLKAQLTGITDIVKDIANEYDV